MSVVRGAGRGAAVLLAALLAAAAGLGWLYATRNVLAGGPTASQALPLEHLAGRDAQPLLHLVPVWIAVGAAMAALLGALRVARPALWAGATIWLVLVITGAASDAVQETQHVPPHLLDQLGRAVIWLEAALAALGAAIAARAGRGRSPRRGEVG